MSQDSSKESILIFTEGRWRGEDAERSVVLTEEAFQQEIVRWLHDQGVTHPTSADRSAAIRAIRKVSYWWTSGRYETRDIQVTPRALFGESLKTRH